MNQINQQKDDEANKKNARLASSQTDAEAQPELSSDSEEVTESEEEDEDDQTTTLNTSGAQEGQKGGKPRNHDRLSA